MPGRLVLEQMLARVSMRRFERTREPVGAEVEARARSPSRSAVSREFVAAEDAPADERVESMIEIVRRTSRNVKRRQSGDMCLRRTAAGTLQAERLFRRAAGYRDLAKLALAIERDLHHR